MRQSSFIVKLSKFCNLRCGYCYEWDELSNKRRMTLETWTRVLEAARYLQEKNAKQYGAAQTDICFHGGEPLVQPLEYLEELMEIRRRVLGDDPAYGFAVQTNLYKVSSKLLDFLKRHDFKVGVSADVVPGVRLSVSGRETERAVLANMDRLREAGIEFGAITVLASHTAPRIDEIYDYFAARKTPLRILPLLLGSDARPLASFDASNDALLSAMERLFVRWIEGGRPIRLQPFEWNFESVLRKMLDITGPLFDRETQGENILIVGVDGTLGRIDDTYEQTPIGSLEHQTLPEIFASDAYRASFAEDARFIQRTCGTCEYAGACSGWPTFVSKHPDDGTGHCAIAYRLNRHIESYLRDNGFTAEELRTLVGSRFSTAA